MTLSVLLPVCLTGKSPSFYNAQPSSSLLGPIMCKNVQKSYFGPCKTNGSEFGRRFQRFYYEKTLVGQANLKVNSLSIKCVNNSSNALKASLTRKSFEDFPETLMEILDRDGKIYAPAFPKEHYMHTEFDRKLYERMVEDNTMLRYFVQVLFAQGKDVTLPHVHFFSNTTHMQEQSQRIHDGERAFYQINYYSWVMQRGSYHRVGKDYPLKIVKETYVPPSESKKCPKYMYRYTFTCSTLQKVQRFPRFLHSVQVFATSRRDAKSHHDHVVQWNCSQVALLP